MDSWLERVSAVREGSMDGWIGEWIAKVNNNSDVTEMLIFMMTVFTTMTIITEEFITMIMMKIIVTIRTI